MSKVSGVELTRFHDGQENLETAAQGRVETKDGAPAKRTARPWLREILVVDADRKRVDGLLGKLSESGFRTTSAGGCLHALTMLEWHRPDLIVVHSEVRDMSAADFYRTVKGDPLFNNVPVAWIEDPRSSATSASRCFDVLLEDGDTDELARQVRALLWRGLESGKPSRARHSSLPPRAAATAATSAHLQSFLALIGQLEEALRTGTLHLQPARGSAAFLIFDHGQVVHADFGGLVGPGALAALLAELHTGARMAPRFEELPRWKLASYPRSIRRVERSRLLRSASGAPDPARGGGS